MTITNPYLIDLFKQLDPDTTILTPNRRLSASLHKFYQQYQLEQNETHWNTPDILPVVTWIQRLWSHYTKIQIDKMPYLLNSIQEQFIWESVLLNSKMLLQITETANMAKSAWSLLKQWQIDIHHPYFQSSEDNEDLHRWTSQFQLICDKNAWIDIASLANLVCDKIHAKQITPAKKIILLGFNEISPQMQSLLNSCTSRGSTILTSHLLQTNKNVKQIPIANEDNELFAMARWAKKTLKEHPDASIACVIPSLDKIRDRVMQVFYEIFSEKNDYQIELNKLPFNISAGKNLLQYPIIKAAMQLLALHKNTISADTLKYLLFSPFLGEAEFERIKRAKFDSLLRKNNITTINLLNSLEDSDKNQINIEKFCPKLAKRIRKFFSYIVQLQETYCYADWAKHFNQLVTSLGWPGERSLNSDEYQTVESWLNILREFASLDQITKPVNFANALHTLHKILAKTPFQVKTPDAPIQILGVLEAAALPFDYIWVAGMDDLSWPPKPKPNPLIPKRLQRELNMPHSSAEREFTYCKQLMELFINSTSEAIFSYAIKRDNIELQASSLICDFPKIEVEELNLEKYQSPCEIIFQSKQIEAILDEKAPSLDANEIIHGGTNIIKQQALCPFKAFAEWRLHARELESPTPGLRSKDRGSIIHKTIELIWKQLKDHASLLSIKTRDLDHIINESISEALNELPLAHSNNTQYFTLEKKRLQKLITDWLEIEKERSPFKVIMSEQSSQISLDKINLNIRIDRVDELACGKKLIIDYKTGKHNDINGWLSERPEEPQLPMYSLLDITNTIGIAFAQIAPGEHCFKGMSEYELEIQGVKPISDIKKTKQFTWGEQLNQWHANLNKLANDFYDGIANVDPKKIPDTCQWCALKPLCRINEEVVI